MRLHSIIAMVVSLALPQCSDSEGKKRNEGGGDETNVGAPCVPYSEMNPEFSGYKVTEESILTGMPACGSSGVCLVNHFQGRVTCPLGQPAPKPCSGPQDASCGVDSQCVAAVTLALSCVTSLDCPDGAFCDGETLKCTNYVCHTGACQIPGVFENVNSGKACCVPGTTSPVTAPVCGQCSDQGSRSAQDAVYCSCRCGVAEGEPDDPTYDFCKCPAGFECREIRKNFGLGDPDLTGKYCIRQGSEFTGEKSCGQVKGYFDSSQCEGISFN
ncbi:MAG: hypothetical protein HUU21_20730 [Polyangiaceae bacterium]|nr:hypothetical protein [Polyangiaceae bacterium]